MKTNPSPKPSHLSIFRNRALLLLCTGELVSSTGSALTTLAASILVYRLTGSALRVSLLLVASALPSLLVGLLAGVFVDRLDRKRILIAADLVRAALSFSIPFVAAHNSAALYGIVLLSSSVGQFFNPAHESILPEIASEEERASANSLMAISGFGATTLGYAACGLIISRYPLAWAFYLDALSYLFSVLCIWHIRVPTFPVPLKTTLGGIAGNLKAGWWQLKGNSNLRFLLICTAPVILAFGLWNSLLMPFTLHTLHASTFDYGLQEGLTTVGFVTGCLLITQLGKRLKLSQWIILSFAGLGIVSVNYALSSQIPLSIGLVVLSGLLNAPYSIARRLIIQQNTPRETRGRVNSVFLVTRDLVYLAGMALAGLADVVDIRNLVLVSGLLLIGAGVVAAWLFGLVKPRQLKVMQTIHSLVSANHP